MIEECEFIQIIGNTVKMRLQERDGSFKNHYHRYKTQAKAMRMYDIFSYEIERRGGVAVRSV